LLALAVAVTALPGCERGGERAAPSASSSGAVGVAPPTTPSAPGAPRSELTCRAIRVDGAVRAQGGPAIAVGGALDGRTWVELADGAGLGLRHSRSGRELVVSGPALVMPCRAGEEELLLAWGRVTTASGVGARPGAEQLIATPFGAIRSVDASLEIRATDSQLSVTCSVGEAQIEPAPGVSSAARSLRAKGRATLAGSPELPALLGACEREAEQAELLARQVLDSVDGGGSLGERAARHVEGRQKARAGCAIAAAAAVTRPEPERAGLFARVAAADRRWKSVPAGGSAGGQ
jgi:hypothetical protein